MQPQEHPARVLLGLYGDCTEGFFLKNLYCLECILVVLSLNLYKKMHWSLKKYIILLN